MPRTLPDTVWPLLYYDPLGAVAYDDANMFAWQRIVSGGYVVPRLDVNGNENGSWLVYGGFNYWMDNNCCGGASFSALQGHVADLTEAWASSEFAIVSVPGSHAIDWGMDSRGRHIFSRDRANKPRLSAFPHVRNYAPDFPALTADEANAWYSGVLCSNLLGVTTKPLLHATDKDGGHLSHRLRFMIAAGESGAVLPMLVRSDWPKCVAGRRIYSHNPLHPVIVQFARAKGKARVSVTFGASTRNVTNLIRTVTVTRDNISPSENKEHTHRLAAFDRPLTDVGRRLDSIHGDIINQPWKVAQTATRPFHYGHTVNF